MPDSKSTGEILLVLGAGPKAVAIAAKWAVLQDRGISVPELVIVERRSVGAHWSGDAGLGYNDGSSLLGTRPERDVGFPYFSDVWSTDEENREICHEMLQYSWQSFLIDIGYVPLLAPPPVERYCDWFDRGGLVPTHGAWAAYLSWVILKISERAGFKLVIANIQRISISDRRWILSRGDGEEPVIGDHLVITGHGLPKPLKCSLDPHPRLLDGMTYWQPINHDKIWKDSWNPQREIHSRRFFYHTNVLVIGLGGTASGIALDLLKVRTRSSRYSSIYAGLSVEMIGREGIRYSRGEGLDENRFHSDPAKAWINLSKDHRRNYIRRTDKGVVDHSTLRELSESLFVRVRAGEVTDVKPDDAGVTVTYRYEDQEPVEERAALVVNAAGFDPLWFLDLLDESARARLAGKLRCTGLRREYWDLCRSAHEKDAQGKSGLDKALGKLEDSINENLAIENFEPTLHLPAIAGYTQGPGFSSLRSLGLLSDRILSRHALI